ncbi:DNA-binding MarR family transcriptional regulator [Oikeobacillus pervagus]|uniref:DNA-binding MarR family transcriptional regulator n=1 Tax=Oikeobacillus pervagus TaxID=1325931 RepID=A0AAJ1WFW6_9BACI|nr:MarR family transcriptional regulator [Oikeobacillus pervagus]MDQ0214412.1 DNA-binding MarR family transcriptional regulator [Oikeobacillus pervagus]
MRKEKLFILEQLFRQVFRTMRYELRHITGEYLSNNEFFVLKTVHENGAIKASDVSKALDVSASHITSVTDSLVEKNFITRSRSATDRRIVELMITEKGEGILAEMGNVKSLYFQGKFNNFNDEEIQLLIELFKKIDTN